MTLESSKYLGGIGAILMLLGVLPYISYFGVVEFVGAILVLAALHGLSGVYGNSEIFSNGLYGFITAIVGAVVTAAVGFLVVLSSLQDFLYQIFPTWNGDWTTLQSLTPDTTNLDVSTLVPFIAGIVIAVIIAWVFAILAAFFFRRSFMETAKKSSVGLFGTAGLLLLIGAFLAIILIGFILMWIAALLLAIAFFQLKAPEVQQPGATVPPSQMPPAPV